MLEKHFPRKKQLKIYNIIWNSSKVLHTWQFILKGTKHIVQLWDSKLSGKKKLAVDEEVIVENNNSIAVFNYSFQLDSYFFNLIQINDTKFDLKINDVLFSEIMEAEESGSLKKNKKKVEEEEEEEECEDTDELKKEVTVKKNDLID